MHICVPAWHTCASSYDCAFACASSYDCAFECACNPMWDMQVGTDVGLCVLNYLIILCIYCRCLL